VDKEKKIIDPEIIINAYMIGFFPMAEPKSGQIGWYSPDPRAIIPIHNLKVSRSLKQTIKKNIFTISFDKAFEAVIRGCANRKETWISNEIIESYLNLYKMGYAHSVESWKDGKLAGGLYGVAIGSAFFGESMFSTVRDASKVALVYLVEHLKNARFELLDSQFITPHLERFGAIEISRAEYLKRLRIAVSKNNSFYTAKG